MIFQLAAFYAWGNSYFSVTFSYLSPTALNICADIEIQEHHYHRIQKRSLADDDDTLVMGSSTTIAATVGSNRILECEIHYPSETKVYIEHIITWRKQGTEVPASWSLLFDFLVRTGLSSHDCLRALFYLITWR